MKNHSLSLRIYLLIIALVMVIGGGLAWAAYRANTKQVDSFYMTKASQLSSAIAANMDGDAMAELKELLMSDEYQAIRKQAEENEDSTSIENYLKENGWEDLVTTVTRNLKKFRIAMGAKYIYLISAMEDGGAISILDPDEPLPVMGEIRPNSSEFAAVRENMRIEPTVSRTDFGWLCSAYDPVKDSKGNAVCMVGVDIDMTDVVNARFAYLRVMLVYASVVGLIAVALAILMMRRTVTRPLRMLSRATDEFAASGEDVTRDSVIDLPIRSQDEIGDLYRKTQTMQIRLLDYMDHLTKVTQERERISAELNVATQIQADMLPRIFPPFPERKEFGLYATMDPAKEVGGDFYDFFLVDDDHLAMVVADVSGKGVPAALFMVIAKTLIKNRAQMGDSPSDVLRNVNNQLCEGNEAELFVTVWLGILEISTGKGWAVNAGHEHPVIRRAGGSYELIVYRHSPAVAVMSGMRFPQHEFHLDPGDALFVYTDGVPEATSEAQELFGTDRMLDVLNSNKDLTPEKMLPEMHRQIDLFVGKAPQFDDITMLLMEYHGPEKKEETMETDAKVENLTKVLGFLDAHLERRECPMKTQMALDVAVEELFVNIASYAYPDKQDGKAWIEIREEHDPEGVTVEFRDEGIPYDPLAKPDPDITLSAAERPIGGLGIFMVKKSMDDMSYEYRDGCNILTIRKNF